MHKKSMLGLTMKKCLCKTGQMCGTIACPVYIDNKLVGVLGIDMTLQTVTDLTKRGC